MVAKIAMARQLDAVEKLGPKPWASRVFNSMQFSREDNKLRKNLPTYFQKSVLDIIAYFFCQFECIQCQNSHEQKRVRHQILENEQKLSF